jgi:hypothetical protein
MAMPRERELPFLIEDMTPREFRVPAGEVVEHPNGALGMRRVVVATPDAEQSAQRYRALLGDPTAADSLAWQLEGVVLGLSSANASDDPVARARAKRIAKLDLTVRGISDAQVLDKSRAHGAVIQLVSGER